MGEGGESLLQSRQLLYMWKEREEDVSRFEYQGSAITFKKENIKRRKAWV